MPKVAIIDGDEDILRLISVVFETQNTDLIYVGHNHHFDIKYNGINIVRDYKELANLEDVSLIINNSDDPQIEGFLAGNINRQTEVIGKQGNRLIRSLLEERSRINEENKKSLRGQREIYELGIKLSSAMNLQEMANTIISCATKLTNTPAGSLAVYNPHKNSMRLVGIKGFSDHFSQASEWPVRKGGMTNFIINHKGPVVIGDVNLDPSFDNPVMKKEGVRSVMAITLVCDGNVNGILYVDDFVPRNFTDEQIAELSLLASHAAFGIQKIHILDELSNTKDYIEAILNNSADMIITTDSNTNIVKFNPGAEAMMGYTKEEVIGTSVELFYPDPNERRKLMERVNEFGSVTNYETKLINKNGKLVDISLTLSQLKDKEGHVIGTVGISKNITRQKMLEDQLKRSNAELAGKIEEVKKLDKMKSDFLSVVSHELRTPLTSIIGFTKMILRRFKKDIQPVIPAGDTEALHSAEKISENLEIVSAEGSRLSRLINNVLDLAKIEAGKIEWNIVQCSLANICKLAANSAQSLAEAKNLALKIEMDDDLPDINGDQDKLLQVVTNLLSNAVKFTDQGSITCRVRNLEEKIEVQIIDTGIGLHAEDIPKMFEKFKQVGDTLTNRPKGTGLGLAICKEIIEAHKGKIWVESEHEKGSRFIFVIPAVKSAKSINIEKTLLLKEIKGKLYNKIQGIAKGHKILVVDDEANIRDLLHQELEEAGYKVIEAADGSEALNKARQERPDLIILDILMPGIDGFDAMTILKKDVNTANIPILIYSIIEDREKGYRLGADDYITKTMGQEELLKAVSSLMAWPMKKQKKILIIESDESISNTIKEILKIEGYNVITADNGEEGILKAQTELPNLIIIDDHISKLNNNEILRTLKYGKGTEDLNIIVLTGDDTTNMVMESN